MAGAPRSDVGPYALIPEWVLDSDLSDRAIRLYCILARYANKDEQAWPARATLAGRLDCSTSSIDRAMDELVALGAVDRQERRRDDGGQTSNLYVVRFTRFRPYPLVLPTDAVGLFTGAEPPMLIPAQAPLGAGEQQNETHSKREPDRLPARSAGPPPEPPEKPPTARQRKRGPRDDLFDALVVAFGEASTESRAKFYGRTVTQLVVANATPEQISAARIEMSRRGWDKPSPEAMLKHWDDLLRSGRPDRPPPRNPAASRFWEQEQPPRG